MGDVSRRDGTDHVHVGHGFLGLFPFVVLHPLPVENLHLRQVINYPHPVARLLGDGVIEEVELLQKRKLLEAVEDLLVQIPELVVGGEQDLEKLEGVAKNKTRKRGV